jgi:hypothetical protein
MYWFKNFAKLLDNQLLNRLRKREESLFIKKILYYGVASDISAMIIMEECQYLDAP